MTKPLMRYLFLALAVALVYAATIGHGFVWDDQQIIVRNPLLEGGNIGRLLLAEDTALGHTGYYRPLTYLSFALDRALWGGNPAGFHLTNLLLQISSVLFFHAVTLALFGKKRLALIAALVFALHPVAGETVNFLSGGRNTLLSASFTLLSLLFYLKRRQVPALAFFTLALCAKEFALLLPVGFLLHDALLKDEKVDFRRYLPYLVPVACYLALRSLAVQKANFLSTMNLSDAAAAPYLALRYLLNLMAPFQLKVLYDVRPTAAWNLASLAVLAVLAGVLYFKRENRELLFAACWLALFLLPVLNLIPLEQAALMADRYAYFSLMGFAWCLALLGSKVEGRNALGAVFALCGAYALIDCQRNPVWKNEERFFARMAADAPDKFDGYQNLGMYYYRKGDSARALPHLKAALSKPDIGQMFLIGSASVFWKENELDAAEDALKRAAAGPRNPEPYLMLIALYERSGRTVLARQLHQTGGYLFPDLERQLKSRPAALCREGDAYLARRLYIPAENVFWQASMFDPDFVPALVGMGKVSLARGNPDAALAYLTRAVALDPADASAQYRLLLAHRMRNTRQQPGP